MIDLNMKPKRKPKSEKPQPEDIVMMIITIIIWSANAILFFRAL